MADRTKPASTPSRERCAERQEFRILALTSDPALNAIGNAAAALFSASTCLTSILNAEPRWNMEPDGPGGAATPQCSALSRTVVAHDAPLFVADTASEPRWESLRDTGNARFCAGAPLRTSAGAVFGALCVFDEQPRPASAKALMPALEHLAQAIAAIAEQTRNQVERSPQKEREQLRLDELGLWDKALAACSSGIVIADARLPDTPIIFCNPAFERISGYRQDEVKGLNCRFLQGEDTDPAAVAQLHAAIGAGVGTHVLLRNYRKDGVPFWNDLTISPLLDPDGTLTHFIGIQNDASDHIETDRQLHQLSSLQRAILDSTNFPLVATAINGVIVTMNEAARRLLRLNLGEQLPVEVASLFDPQELASRARELGLDPGEAGGVRITPLFASASKGEVEEREWTWIASDGSRVSVLLSCSAIRDASGEITGFLLSGIDLTVRKTMLDELQKLAAVVENSSDFVGISTLGGEVLYVNRSGRRMLGLSDAGALPSRRMYRYVTPETLQLIRHTVNPLVQRGETWEGPCTLRHFLTNEIVEVEGSCFPVPGHSGGGHVCLAAVLRNVTREHRAIRALTYSEQRFSDVVAASGEVVWELGPKLTITYLSERVTDLLGYDPAELVGIEFLKLVHPDDAQYAAELCAMDAIRREPFRDREYRAVHKDGSVVWVRLAGVPVLHEDGSLASYRGVCLDITGKRRTQLELEAAKEAAEEAARTKSLFLANMSHEIRTPLSGIIGMTSILFDSGLSASQRECVDTIRGSGEALLDILSDILDISKIESGRMEIASASFDLRDCVASSVKLFQPGAAAKGITLSLEIGAEVPASMVGDSLHLRQILNNLIGNALKFAGPCQVLVRVEAQPAAPDGWLMRFDVADTGAGIPFDRLGRLFRAFSQVDASHVRQHGGAGLGLAIGKRLAEMMGGTMWVRSQPGAGTTFSFTIHAGEHEAPKSVGAVAAAPFTFDPSLALRCPLRILVAEDNPVNQKIAVFLLRKLGYQADLAANGYEVLKRLETSVYDMILLDIQMPGMDGLQAARAVRGRFGDTRRPWLVALTANARADDRREAAQAGINDYLSKPVQGAELQAAIERAAGALEPAAFDADSEPQEASWSLPEGLRELQDGDVGVVHEILTLFLQDSAPLVNEILAACGAGDRETLRRLLHRFKGSASQVGAARLTSLCLEAESGLRESSGLAPAVRASVEGIKEEWPRAAGAIRHWLGGRAAGA